MRPTKRRRRTCESTCDRVVPATGARAGDDRADRGAADHDPALADTCGAALAVGPRPATSAAPAVAGAPAPGAGEHHARRAVRALDRLGVRVPHPTAVLRAHPLRHCPGVSRVLL